MTSRRVCPQCGVEYPGDERFCPRDGSTLVPTEGGAGLAGRTIAGRYHVLRLIGAGGMGEVFLAEHVKMGRQCALKVIRPALLNDREALARFNREAANASRINHPNVAAIYDFGESEDGLVFLAMEYVDGRSLEAIVDDEGPMSLARASRIISQVASALDDAHALGIVHRDLKPDNVLVAKSRDGTDVVKVVDFGIARMMEAEGQRVTRSGFVVGTPDYMSPEQLAGDDVDGGTDQYALALLSFHVLTGTLPFKGATSHESMMKRLTERPASLGDARGDISWPPRLQPVFDQALARLPGERFARVTGFSAAFSAAVSDLDPAAAQRRPGTPGYSRAIEPMTGLARFSDVVGGDHSAAPAAAATPGPAAWVTQPPQPSTSSGVGSNGAGSTVELPDAEGWVAPPSRAAAGRRGLLVGILIGGSVAIAAVAVVTALSRRTAVEPTATPPSTPVAKTDTVFVDRSAAGAAAPPQGGILPRDSARAPSADPTLGAGKGSGTRVASVDSSGETTGRGSVGGAPGPAPRRMLPRSLRNTGGTVGASDSFVPGTVEAELSRVEALVAGALQGGGSPVPELRAARRRVENIVRRVPSRIVQQRAFFDGVMLDALLAPAPRVCNALDQAAGRSPDPRLQALGRDVHRSKCQPR